MFANCCAATNVTNIAAETDLVRKEYLASIEGSITDGPFKMAFEGCGVTNGLTGLLFASGLRDQCVAVKQMVCAL